MNIYPTNVALVSEAEARAENARTQEAEAWTLSAPPRPHVNIGGTCVT